LGEIYFFVDILMLCLKYRHFPPNLKNYAAARGQFLKRIFVPTGKVGAYASVGLGSVRT
jgi:hypothetical protein